MITQDIHARSLARSTALSAYYMPNLITPLDVIRVLKAANVRFMLVGAHGVGGWMRKPRATEDVDVLAGYRQEKKAVRALLAAFPHLKADDHEVVTRLRDSQSGDMVIDVLKPNQSLLREALRYAHVVESGGRSYRIPSLELALTMKFARMTSPNRADEDKFLDAHDFMYMVDSNPDIDLEKLAQLGDLVYPGGGVEIVEKVRQVRAGEKMKL
jgi:hypothetical protein